jgi:hypothetical protein
VLYNQDCTNLFAVTKEPVTPGHVDRMVDEVAEGGADVMLINPNAQRVNYPSRVWQTFWDGYAPGRREFFGPVPEADLAGREAYVAQMKCLADQGCNYLTRALARCRQKGIVPGLTIRMNDMHDIPWLGSHMFSRFYLEHPELRLNNSSFCGWSATSLNYEHAAVREHYLALVRELAGEYDFDVLELDFLRFQCYFPRDDFARHAEIMTGFIREVRNVLNATGRRIALTARLGATPAIAYELGFDPAAWAREKIIDGISAGAFLNTQWAIPVDEFRALVGEEIAVYASEDYAVDRRPGLPERQMPLEPRYLRGFAAGHLATGADGVEMFNFFCSREGTACDQQPSFATLRELGALSQLRGSAKSYTLTFTNWVQESDGASQVPVTLEPRRNQQFELLLAAEPDAVGVEVSVFFTGEFAGNPAELWLALNNCPVGPARGVEPVPESAKGAIRRAVFSIPARALRDGRNHLVLRNEGKAMTVISLDLLVTPV